ncbi:MAG: DNA polymerase III subunit delta [Acidimicrobiia bacterium]|nr:DNA polymerase III subunit delta [Acidimicrobiia bacterium]
MIVFVKGSDDIVRAEAVSQKIAEAVGEDDRSLVLEELTEDTYRRADDDRSFDIARLVDAAQTPPFLTDHRVVVGRHLGRFTTKDSVQALVGYLADPLASTRLILVWEAGLDPKQDRLTGAPKALAEALAAAGAEVVDASITSGKGAGKWLDAQLAQSTLRFDGASRAAIAEQLGEDRSRVIALVATLEATFGDGTLGVEEVTPYLGEKGTVPPWDLTDAIDKGDIAMALDVAGRVMGAGERHGLAVLATLHTHFGRMLQLDGTDVRDEKAAAHLLGMKGSTFPAKKALTQSRRLGSDKVARAVRLIADADLDLRGCKDWPDQLVIEVLVARLAALAR